MGVGLSLSRPSALVGRYHPPRNAIRLYRCGAGQLKMICPFTKLIRNLKVTSWSDNLFSLVRFNRRMLYRGRRQVAPSWSQVVWGGSLTVLYRYSGSCTAAAVGGGGGSRTTYHALFLSPPQAAAPPRKEHGGGTLPSSFYPRKFLS